MSKKTLISIIVILAVILVAGIAAIFVLPDPAAPNAGDDMVANAPATQETGEPAEETDAVGEPVEPDVSVAATEEPTEEAAQETTGGDGDDPTSPTKKPSTVKPTAPAKDPTAPSQSTKPTKPQPTTPQPTTPQPTEPEETGPIVPGMEEVDVPDSDEVTYEEYYAMSADEQASFINSFESIEAFFAWHTAAKEEYENNRIEIDGSTPIDLGDILGGN